MALSLHTNNAALSAQNSLGRSQNALSTSMTRLSTGYRINSAMDDAAGLQIATRLKAQTSGMAVAMRNTQNSTSMLQTAEGALDEVSTILIRMKDLATQAADQSSTVADKTAMQLEYDALGKEMYNVVTNTTFAGAALLTAATGTISTAMKFQIGASATEVMDVDLSADMTAMDTALITTSANYATGAMAAGAEISTAANATANITDLNTTLAAVGKIRSSLGAAANRLDHVYNNLSNISTNSKAAMGRIMDVDFATESSSMTSNQMLMQAGTAMLKQSNSMSSMVMSLLQ